MGDPSHNSGGQETPPYPTYPLNFDLEHLSPQPRAGPVPHQLFQMPHMIPQFQAQQPQFGSPQPWLQPWLNPSTSQNFPFPHAAPQPQYASNEPIAAAPSRSKKKSKQKGCSLRAPGSSSRGPSYTVAEDKVLCSAYLNVSRDPIVGAYQTSDTYWDRITKYFNENSKSGPSRSAYSLSTRWHNIAKDTARFCGIKAEIDRLRESGKTDADRIEDAVELFRGRCNRPFQFLHCWHVLRNTRKWQDCIASKGTDPSAETEAPIDVDPEDASVDADSTEELPRPIGRDRAKKRCADGSQTSESSACLDLLEKMARNREIKNQQEAAWAIDQKQLQERQLALQEDQIRIQLLQEESKIMTMDLTHCSDAAREYFLCKQQEILQKIRRERDSSGN